MDFPIPVPARLILFSPHPDDISISLGALTARAAQLRIPTSIVLVTDGSEARLPTTFLEPHGWSPNLTPAQQQSLRGRVRAAEALEEGLPIESRRSPNSHKLQISRPFRINSSPPLRRQLDLMRPNR